MSSWVLMLGLGHINHNCEYVLSPTLSIYFALIVIPLLNFIYYMMGLLICKYEPFWQEVSVKSSDSLLRWPLRPLGLLLIAYDLLKKFWVLIEFLFYKEINYRIIASLLKFKKRCFNIFGNVLVYSLFETQRYCRKKLSHCKKVISSQCFKTSKRRGCKLSSWKFDSLRNEQNKCTGSNDECKENWIR